MGQYRAKLVELYEQGYTTKDLRKYFKVSGESLGEALKRLYGEDHIRQTRYSRIAAKSKAYTGNRSHPKLVELKETYSVTLKPDWWTKPTKRKYVRVHELVYCESHGLTEIPNGYDVHHIDFNKQNNDISNLILLSRSNHMHVHMQHRRCNDYPEREYTQVSGSAENPTYEG